VRACVRVDTNAFDTCCDALPLRAQAKELETTWLMYVDELIAGVRLAADDPRPIVGVYDVVVMWCTEIAMCDVV
jgi:hypothetical protein